MAKHNEFAPRQADFRLARAMKLATTLTNYDNVILTKTLTILEPA